MPGIQDFNLGGGGSPASPQDVYPLMERFIASMDSAAQRIGANIHQSMVQDQANSQTKAMAGDAQALLQQNGNNPQALNAGLIGLLGKYPRASQTPGGQGVLQTLGNSISAASNASFYTGMGSAGTMPMDSSGVTTGTTFATPADQALYARTGGKEGDNAVGAGGNYTGVGSPPQVSFPESFLKEKYGSVKAALGQPVTVWNPATGQQVQARIGDAGPADWTGAGIDLNPTAASNLGISSPDNFKGPIKYQLGNPSGVMQANQTTPRFSQPSQDRTGVDAFTPSERGQASQLQQGMAMLQRVYGVVPRNPQQASFLRSQESAAQKQVQEAQSGLKSIAFERARLKAGATKEEDTMASRAAYRKDREKFEADKDARYWAGYGQRQQTINAAATARTQATNAADRKEADRNYQFAINDQMRSITEQIRSAQQEKSPIEKQIANLDISINASTDKDKIAEWQSQKEDLQDESNQIQQGIDRLNDEMNSLKERLGSLLNPSSTSAPTQITNDADYNALPSGTVFVDPKGVKRIKP